ncbi:hypothetical protein [Paenibacillus sedimenti]|uniref:Uncharacterized protein n=1 Tax=Paenibacillus sedimenti TaxID=2770274 RepID=A0A926KWL8_9BACL|nr:hypothetical protein [Paenibacillus sedimenti]MBD0383300.1 hypothetical protein [Paenibacillus sedimenti]
MQAKRRKRIVRFRYEMEKLTKNRLKRKVKQPKARISQIVSNGGFETGGFFPWRDVGNVSVTSGFPRTGRFAAFFNVLPNRTASITQQVRLPPPGPRGIYLVSLWVARTTFNTNGTYVISLSSSVQPPAILQMKFLIPELSYKRRGLSVPASALRSRTNDLRIELNAGPGTSSVGLEVDDVQIEVL